MENRAALKTNTPLSKEKKPSARNRRTAGPKPKSLPQKRRRAHSDGPRYLPAAPGARKENHSRLKVPTDSRLSQLAPISCAEAEQVLAVIAATIRTIPIGESGAVRRADACAVYPNIKEMLERLLPWIMRSHRTAGYAIYLRMKLADQACGLPTRVHGWETGVIFEESDLFGKGKESRPPGRQQKAA